ncbi:MAG: AMP-binding protein [Phycisphaeraceae bacterium]
MNSQPDATTCVQLLRDRAAAEPDGLAYRFLRDGEEEAQERTYGQLDQDARRVGALLQSAGAVGQRVLLLHPPGGEFVAGWFGCLYAGAVAVPVAPPHSTRQARAVQRLGAIVRDAQPAVAMTTSRVRSVITACLGDGLGAAAPPCLTSDELAPDLAELWRPCAVNPDALACIQYTSGATAQPRGVLLSHANLLHNSAMIQQAFGHTRQSRGVIWLPPYHDMGLIGGILQPIYAGFPVTLMSPAAFLQQPIRWLCAISRYGATTSGGPNFAYDLCVSRTTPAQRAALDLTSWDLAFSGAEPIDAGTLDRFAQAFAPAGFNPRALYPCYGLAEATLMVSGGAKGRSLIVRKQGAAMLVGCGRPRGGQDLIIVDPQTNLPCPDGHPGQICVRGPSIAKGYWNNSPATQATFGDGSAADGPPFLRTGDLGVLDEQGELFVTGRLKDLIIIRGVHYHPHEIERSAQQSHPALAGQRGAAFPIDTGSGEAAALVHEVDRQHRDDDPEPIIAAICRRVSQDHELALHVVVLVKPGQVATTGSGKVQRHRSRQAFEDGKLEVIAAWRADGPGEDEPGRPAKAALGQVPAVRAYLIAKFAAAMHITGDEIDPDESLARYGLDSLAAVNVALAIADELHVELPPSLLWDYPTITALAGYLVEQCGVHDPATVATDGAQGA